MDSLANTNAATGQLTGAVKAAAPTVDMKIDPLSAADSRTEWQLAWGATDDASKENVADPKTMVPEETTPPFDDVSSIANPEIDPQDDKVPPVAHTDVAPTEMPSSKHNTQRDEPPLVARSFAPAKQEGDEATLLAAKDDFGTSDRLISPDPAVMRVSSSGAAEPSILISDHAATEVHMPRTIDGKPLPETTPKPLSPAKQASAPTEVSVLRAHNLRQEPLKDPSTPTAQPQSSSPQAGLQPNPLMASITQGPPNHAPQQRQPETPGARAPRNAQSPQEKQPLPVAPTASVPNTKSPMQTSPLNAPNSASKATDMQIQKEPQDQKAKLESQTTTTSASVRHKPSQTANGDLTQLTQGPPPQRPAQVVEQVTKTNSPHSTLINVPHAKDTERHSSEVSRPRAAPSRYQIRPGTNEASGTTSVPIVQKTKTVQIFDTIKPHLHSAEADLPLAGASSFEQVTRSATVQTLASTTTPHIAATRQIAQAFQQAQGQQTELFLNPEELGKVRISLRTSEQGMIVQIFSERSETTDLLRRHINDLSRDFSELGYNDINFSFSEQKGKWVVVNTPDTDELAEGDTSAPVVGTHVSRSGPVLQSDNSIDIRL